MSEDNHITTRIEVEPVNKTYIECHVCTRSKRDGNVDVINISMIHSSRSSMWEDSSTIRICAECFTDMRDKVNTYLGEDKEDIGVGDKIEVIKLLPKNEYTGVQIGDIYKVTNMWSRAGQETIYYTNSPRAYFFEANQVRKADNN